MVRADNVDRQIQKHYSLWTNGSLKIERNCFVIHQLQKERIAKFAGYLETGAIMLFEWNGSRGYLLKIRTDF